MYIFDYYVFKLRCEAPSYYRLIMNKLEFAKELLAYETPQVRVIEVEVEKGFALSGGVEGETGHMPIG
mgnify:CR=1 FL=1